MQHWQSTSIYYSTTHECVLVLALHRQTVNTCMCVCVCVCVIVHARTHQDQHKSWICTWAKWLQMLILWVRNIINLNSGELPLGDTNVFWLFFFCYVLCCFSYRCSYNKKRRLAAVGDSTFPLLTALSIKRKLHCMLEAVCVPRDDTDQIITSYSPWFTNVFLTPYFGLVVCFSYYHGPNVTSHSDLFNTSTKDILLDC